MPRGYAGRPVSVFETGGSTGVPKARINIDDFRTDYEMFSATLPDSDFPRGADWLQVGPTGPRRLRLAVEHLCQFRGGICFMVDLDPRWVIKLVKSGDLAGLERYKQHVVDQALTLLKAHENIRCLFTTPKLLEALCEKASLRKLGIRGVFCGGTEMTPQFHRFAVEELMEGAYFAPTYGNTLMGLAVHKPRRDGDSLGHHLLPAFAAGGDRGGRPGRARARRRVRRDRPRAADDAHQGVLHAALPRARRGRARAPLRSLSLGRRAQRPALLAPADGGGRGSVLMLHLPILRQGRPYRSVQIARVPHFRTRETFVQVSEANAGLVRRDLLEDRQAEMRMALEPMSVRELVAACARAAERFLNGTLPVGDEAQAPLDHVRQVSATTGLPHVLVRRNMQKIHGVMAGVGAVLDGLTRGLDQDVLDRGHGVIGGHAVSFVPRSPTLGVVLPSNSPGVHSLWVPALALKTALVLKPGGAEPWTPYRLIQAFVAAGVPPEAFGYYPTDHAGAGEILRRCGRGMVFGDVASTRAWHADPRVEVHGPGYSKVLLGPDAAEEWPRYLEVMASSIAENGGRSCVNASGVWTTARADAIAEALAERLARVVPRAEDDPEAQLAPFANPEVAHRISASIDEDLARAGAVDVTARHRRGPRVVEWQGSTYLLPTIVRCQSAEHPLANREFLFPFAAVVEVPVEAVPDVLGPTLAVTVITEDAALRRRILASHLLQRLNFGPLPTWQVSWDQPHEGNLFEHLYVRRAIQTLPGAA